MKRHLTLIALLSIFTTACSQDEYADLRKMTIQDYLNNRPLLNEVREKCRLLEIKDEEICNTSLTAVNEIHDIW